MKKLPIGIQTLTEIIEKNYLYIDKTKLINELINAGKYFLISRPRRFGKSLLVSTLNEIFKGNKELFKGLYIYDKIQWKKNPIIHLSMASLTDSANSNNLFSYCNMLLMENAINNGIEFETDVHPALTFNKLIKALSQINQVVILIDEYDKPIIDYIDNHKVANQNKEFLRDFYSVIKNNDANIKFC